MRIGSTELVSTETVINLVLTADIHAAMECFSDFRVHRNQEVLLLSENLVAIQNLPLHPFLELLPDNSIHDGDQPRPTHLAHVSIFRQEIFHSRVFHRKFDNTADAEGFILWNEENLDVVTFEAMTISKAGTKTYNLRFPVTKSRRK